MANSYEELNPIELILKKPVMFDLFSSFRETQIMRNSDDKSTEAHWLLPVTSRLGESRIPVMGICDQDT